VAIKAYKVVISLTVVIQATTVILSPIANVRVPHPSRFCEGWDVNRSYSPEPGPIFATVLSSLRWVKRYNYPRRRRTPRFISAFDPEISVEKALKARSILLGDQPATKKPVKPLFL
jgi:hypothetical protein